MSRTTPATALLSQAASRYGQALTSHYTQAWLNRFLKHRRNCSAYRVRADGEMRRDGDITGVGCR